MIQEPQYALSPVQSYPDKLAQWLARNSGVSIGRHFHHIHQVHRRKTRLKGTNWWQAQNNGAAKAALHFHSSNKVADCN
ncbi:hypothetical protein HYU40_04275 [Candidatus Woesearchaeota archaeon]|nr:hypothetical protein [Candidatus Woesearchaeota archaeon]